MESMFVAKMHVLGNILIAFALIGMIPATWVMWETGDSTTRDVRNDLLLTLIVLVCGLLLLLL